MIGQMRDRVLIKYPVDIPVPGAGAKTEYRLYLTCWTKIEPIRSNRVFQDSQLQLNDGFSFTVRVNSSSAIDKTMLVEYNGRDYTIDSIKERHNRGRFLDIVATTDAQTAQIIVS